MEVGIVLLPILVIILLVFFYIKPQLQMQKQSEELMLQRFGLVKDGDSLRLRDSDTIAHIPADSLSIRVARLEREKEILINDIRQETNNAIEKQNLQLTFWLAIIALLGTLIPIIIQYRLYIINREKLAQEIAYYRDFVRSHALHNIAGNFTYVTDTPTLIDSQDRTSILVHLIKESAEIFEEIVESVTLNYKLILTPDISSLLLQSLMQTSIIVNRVRILGITREHEREYRIIHDSVNTAINMVLNSSKGKNSIDSNDLIKQLHYVAHNLYMLTRCLPPK